MELEAKSIQRVESDSSIEVSKNSKGFTYSVKAYGASPQEIGVKLKELAGIAASMIRELEG